MLTYYFITHSCRATVQYSALVLLPQEYTIWVNFSRKCISQIFCSDSHSHLVSLCSNLFFRHLVWRMEVPFFMRLICFDFLHLCSLLVSADFINIQRWEGKFSGMEAFHQNVGKTYSDLLKWQGKIHCHSPALRMVLKAALINICILAMD